MTTIILVAIGILIAGAAALMMIFFGGDAFSSSETKAQAARLVSEGAQVEYATDLFYRERGEMPGIKDQGASAIKELIDNKYLTHNPQGAIKANGDSEKWTLEYGSDGMIYSRLGLQSDEASMSICREARRQLQFKDVDADGKLKVYKCDGSNHPGGFLPDREPCCIRG